MVMPNLLPVSSVTVKNWLLGNQAAPNTRACSSTTCEWRRFMPEHFWSAV